MLRLRLFVVLALVPAVPHLAAAQISASRKAEARQHYESGSRKFDVAKYDEAAAEFEAAYEIIGDGVILYNIAQSYRLAQKHERALFFYKSYLRRVENAPNRTEVESRIADLTKVVAEQKRATEAPPTTLSTDKGSTTEHNTRVASTDRPRPDPVERPIEKPPEKPPVENPPETGTTTESTGVTQTPTTPSPSRAPLFRIVGYSLLGVAVAGIAVGAAGAALASSASSNVENAARNHLPFDPSQESKGKGFDVMNIVGFTLAGVAAVGAGVFLYLGLKPQPSARAMIPTVVPLASSQTAGLAVLGRF